ncbi:MAG: hypothetical protein GYB67_13935 [Chloroflexi bacterium]|nr:hypothetical protein [Chloroflexota bacterium]
MTEGYVLVVGSAAIDVKAQLPDLVVWGASNAGYVRNRVGGVARNIAENLAQLEVETVLLTAVGRDMPGRRVIRRCRTNGIDCSHVRVVTAGHTAGHVTLLKPDGEMQVAVIDYEIMDYVNRKYLLRHEPLFAAAAMVVIDATLTDEALTTIFELCAKHDLRICADPTAPALAGRLCAYLNQLYMIAPNAAETRSLCGLPDLAQDRDSALGAARHLIGLGTTLAVVTMGDQGVAYADANGAGFIRAPRAQVIDATGAGDAFTSAVIFGLLNAVSVDEAMRLGITAASLTLQSTETVLPELSQELLYDRLVV